MRIGVYLKGNLEDIYKEIPLNSLTAQENIKKALEKLGITKDCFSHAFIEVVDKDTNIPFKKRYKNYEDFLKDAWYIRQKLLKHS